MFKIESQGILGSWPRAVDGWVPAKMNYEKSQLTITMQDYSDYIILGQDSK